MTLTALLLVSLISPADGEDFVGLLESCHLVVDGIVVGVETNTWETAGGCDKPAESNHSRLGQYRVSVTRTLHGVAPDSIIVVRVLGFPTKFPPGTRVLAFGNHVCVDGGRFWGDAIRWSDFSDTLAKRSNETGFSAFEQAAGIALVRLKTYTKIDRMRFSYTCDSLGWVTPTTARVPSTILFSRPSIDCRPDTGPGVTLVLPIPPGFASDTLEVTGCTNGWRLEDGIVAGFGVPPAELERALAREGGTFRVRSRLLPR